MTEQTAQGMKSEKGSKAKSRWRDADSTTHTLGATEEGGRQERGEGTESYMRAAWGPGGW